MQPTRSQIHEDRILQGFVQVVLPALDTVWRDAMPSFDPGSASGKYRKWVRKHHLMNSMARRTAGGPYARGGFEFEDANFYLDQWGLEKAMADELIREADGGINLEQAAVRYLERQNSINGTELFAAAFMALSIWATDDNNSATDWDSTGTPITNVQTAQQTVMTATGYIPNAMVCGKIVYNALLTNSQITGLVSASQNKFPRDMKSLIATALDLDELHVSTATHDTAAEGLTAVPAPIIDDDALVYYKEDMLSLESAVSGALFHWGEGGGLGTYDRYRDESVKSDIARVTSYYDHFVVASDLGYFFADIV